MTSIEKLQKYAQILNAGWADKSIHEKRYNACLLLSTCVELRIAPTTINTGLPVNPTGFPLDSLLSMVQRMHYQL